MEGGTSTTYFENDSIDSIFGNNVESNFQTGVTQQQNNHDTTGNHSHNNVDYEQQQRANLIRQQMALQQQQQHHTPQEMCTFIFT